MLIEKTISNWFAQLYSQLVKVKDDCLIYGYSSNMPYITKDYCEAALILLRNHKPLPAQMVTRALAEIVIKFCWCIKDAKGNDVSFYSKAQIWTKQSLSERLRYLKRAQECFNNNSIQRNIENVTKDFDKLRNVQDMPNNLTLCKNVFGEENGTLHYHILFGGMNPIVHSNLGIIQKLQIVQTGGLSSDEDDEILVEQLCMVCVYLLIKSIYKYYDIDFSNIERDYKYLKK